VNECSFSAETARKPEHFQRAFIHKFDFFFTL